LSHLHLKKLIYVKIFWFLTLSQGESHSNFQQLKYIEITPF
jgi:hypothetical protein